MHHLLYILATLSLASAIPLPDYDSPTPSNIVASNPWDTTFTDITSTDTNSPNAPLLLSENWTGSGLDQSWTGKDRQPSDSSGMGPRPGQDTPSLGGTWPATPDRDGSHAPHFNPKPQVQDGGPAPLPLDTTGSGAANPGASLLNGILQLPNGPEPAGGL